MSRFRVEAFLDSKFLELFREMRRRGANVGEMRVSYLNFNFLEQLGEMRRKPSELEDCERNSEKCVEKLLEVES